MEEEIPYLPQKFSTLTKTQSKNQSNNQCNIFGNILIYKTDITNNPLVQKSSENSQSHQMIQNTSYSSQGEIFNDTALEESRKITCLKDHQLSLKELTNEFLQSIFKVPQ